jgi:hypothetical protein
MVPVTSLLSPSLTSWFHGKRDNHLIWPPLHSALSILAFAMPYPPNRADDLFTVAIFEPLDL